MNRTMCNGQMRQDRLRVRRCVPKPESAASLRVQSASPLAHPPQSRTRVPTKNIQVVFDERELDEWNVPGLSAARTWRCRACLWNPKHISRRKMLRRAMEQSDILGPSPGSVKFCSVKLPIRQASSAIQLAGSISFRGMTCDDGRRTTGASDYKAQDLCRRPLTHMPCMGLKEGHK